MHCISTVWKNLEKFWNSEKKFKGLEKVWNSVISLTTSGKSLENYHLVKKCTTVVIQESWAHHSKYFGLLSGDLMLRQIFSKSYQLGLDF
jgi:hypothetical protein